MQTVALCEPILEDTYPMYAGYIYVVDGEPKMNEWGGSNWTGITVLEYKRRTGANEVRRCDMAGRDQNRKVELIEGAPMTDIERGLLAAEKRRLDNAEREVRQRNSKRRKKTHKIRKVI